MNDHPRSESDKAARIESALIAELHACSKQIGAPQARELLSLGVSADAFVRASRKQFLIMSWASIETHQSAFRLDPDAKPDAFVHGVQEGGYLLDLIAWRAEKPERWYARTGYGYALGMDEIVRCRAQGKPLLLHSTPLRWLAAGAEGAVLLMSPTTAFVLLPEVVVISEDDMAYGEYLDAMRNRPAFDLRVRSNGR